MDIVNEFLKDAGPFVPLVITAVVFFICQLGAARVSKHLIATNSHQRLRFQIMMGIFSVIGCIAMIIAAPLSEELQIQLLSLLGLLLSGAIAFSSTTFISNILASLMLRIIQPFHVGDFITLNDWCGRVTELGLLHVEIQTEESDLVTIPNMMMVSTPVKVVRANGTIVTAEVSLGYDTHHTKVQSVLHEALTNSPFESGFVHVKELGDFSIVYKVSAALSEVKSVLTSRSELRILILDSLHEAGIEIMSPNFMNTRALGDSEPMIPRAMVDDKAKESKTVDEPKAEDMIFEKAELAEESEKLKAALVDIERQLEDSTDAQARKTLEDRKATLQQQIEDENIAQSAVSK